ncbi:hypothetical protein ACVXG7_25790 [Enterobacter hormaechei]
MRLVIIGNGMAATRLIASLTGVFPVVSLSPSSVTSRAHTTAYSFRQCWVAKAGGAICLHDEDWYTARGVTVLRGNGARSRRQRA